MTLSRSQIAVLHVARRDLHLQDEDYRAILKRCGGVESATDLDRHGFENAMNHFARLGFKSTWKNRTFGNRRGMATPSQVELIRKLWLTYRGDPVFDDGSFNAWLLRFHKVDALRFVTREKAHAVIAALKSMAGRSAK